MSAPIVTPNETAPSPALVVQVTPQDVYLLYARAVAQQLLELLATRARGEKRHFDLSHQRRTRRPRNVIQ